MTAFKSFLGALILVVLALVEADHPGVPNYNAGGFLWPRPLSSTQGTNILTLNNKAWTFTAPVKNSLLDRAFARYSKLFFPTYEGRRFNSPGPTSQATISGLVVNVGAASETDQIQLNTDESYTLQISTTGATLKSATVFGALRGLETFSQLIYYTSNTYYINETTIQDAPRFAWRGLLIDSSRHWLPPSTIYQVIDGLSWSKLNTLHWHIVDGQSFAYQSQVYPLLSGMGSYTPSQIYTQKDIKDLVAYANDRGVRIVPEFDMPAHASSWGFGYDFMTIKCNSRRDDYDFNDGWGDDPMDPTNPDVYTFIQNFLIEINTIFPDNWIHLGGDEINYQCWNITRINDYMKQHNIATYNELEAIFIQKINSFIKAKLNKQMAYWEEVFDNTSPFIGSAVDVWLDGATLLRVIQSGNHAIQSYGWYLDNLDADWYQFYSREPIPQGATPAQAALVLGGEGSMWGETVDFTNLHQKVWTRLSGIAERLWSPKDVTDQVDAIKRLSHHRCRYVRRGIPAEPFQPGPSCYN